MPLVLDPTGGDAGCSGQLNLPNTTATVKSLFNICVNFVVRHIDSVDSFVGFPEQVGEQIFERFSEEYLQSPHSIHDALTKFSDAYKHSVLKKLDLSQNLLVLNEHMETIVVIARYVTELCLCDCSLGENHEILNYICEFQCLQKLCLRHNYMNDASLRLLTLRMRMHGLGGKEIRCLNLEGNEFTDAGLPFLRAFPNVEFLDLTGSKISAAGVEILADRFNLMRISAEKPLALRHGVRTEGWATVFLQIWTKEVRSRRLFMNLISRVQEHKFAWVKRRGCRTEPCDMMCIGAACLVNRTASGPPMAFQRTTPPQKLSPSSPKKRKISSMCEKEIEEDIFSGYNMTM